MYQERPSRLAGSVVWRRMTTTDNVRILPDGCMDLIWVSGSGLLVAGPDSRAHIFSSPPGRTLVGIRFAPGVGPKIFGVPAQELTDQRIALDCLWSAADVRCFVERVATSPEPGRVLEAIAAERFRDVRDGPEIAEIVRLLRAGRSIAHVAEVVGLSERQLRRRSLDAFGYGPKTLARILRLNGAVDLAQSGLAFAEVAAEAGYADQAHLARDVKSFAGVSLSHLAG